MPSYISGDDNFDSADVGGGVELITSHTFTTAAASWDITLPTGYDYHILQGNWPVPSTAWNDLRMRFFDASALITGAEYHVGKNERGSYFTDLDSQYAPLTGAYHANNSGDYIFGRLQIWHALDSSVQTVWEFTGDQRSVNYLGTNTYPLYIVGRMLYAEVNSKVRFYPNSGNLSPQTGRTDKVSVYGHSFS